MSETKEYSHSWGERLIKYFVILSLILVFLTAYTKYIFAKDYYFYIESPCDPSTTKCFVRDCDDYCPPNGLETYSAYNIKASTYSSCLDNSCVNICESSESEHLCTPIACDETTGDECSQQNI